MKERPTIKKIVLNRIISTILFVFIAAYLIVSPKYFLERIGTEPYRDFFLPKIEPSSGVIKVWHIVSFKPYSGSLGNWLKNMTKKYSNKYVNVYFDVYSMTREDAEEQLARDERPDIISFALGACPKELLKECVIEDGSRALAFPYCASGYLLVYDPNAAVDKSELIDKAGSVNDFKKGATTSCVCDIRGAGDLFRAQLEGKCPYFTAEPIDAENDLVQYIALFKEIDEKKTSYAKGFIEYLLSESAQASIASLGLLPINKDVDAEFDREWIGMLWDSFDPSEVPALNSR